MTYSVTLYLGNLGFTNDYSNVLHFTTRDERDKFFDDVDTIPSVSSINIYNTDVNRIMIEGGKVKIAFDTEMFGVALEIGSSDALDKVTYMCINTEFLHKSVDVISSTDSRKYYFVNSYEIISSNSNVTIVSFKIEYDYWMNNQFDFEIKPSNVERMHIDRWDASENKIKYTRPILDAIESNMKVFREDSHNIGVNTYVEDGNYVPIIWCVVTASHTFASEKDTLLYHIIPIKFDAKHLKINTDAISDPFANDKEFFYQDCIKYLTDTRDYFYPSIHMLDSGYLAVACGNGSAWGPMSGSDKDVVTIINVQILVDLPLRLTNTFPRRVQIKIEDEDNPGNNRWRDLPICGGVPNSSPIVSDLLISAYVTDFSAFITAPSYRGRATYEFEVSRPSKPTEFVNNVKAPYNPEHEPALYLSPIMVRYISSCDNTAMTQIPDQIVLDLYTSNMVDISAYRPYISLKYDLCTSYSSTNMYNYLVFNGYTRESLNKLGFAFNRIGYMWDFTNDSYENYVMTQRESDRMMMWTNIATGGISEMGSTAVSSGIGFRSNIERALALENSLNADKTLANFASGGMQEARIDRNVMVNKLNADMYKGMAKNAMMMSGIGGTTAFSANAIHQGMAQRAREKSMANQPPATATSGNTCSAIANHDFNIIYTETRCDDSTYELYKNVFHKFGYYIGNMVEPQLYNRKFFNYIKTNGCILTGSVNNLILSALASILDNGVTLWHMDYCVEYSDETITGLYIHDYSYENIERSLI